MAAHVPGRGSLDPAPATVTAATDAYRREMDALAEWLKDCCQLEAGALATVAELRESYEAHCKAPAARWWPASASSRSWRRWA